HSEGKIVCENFEPGQNLKIKEGALKEKEGVVIRQSKHKVVLQIEQLGISLTAEVPKTKVTSVK
ncbi:MAG TPA: hypothetical protein VFM82_06425, partial [Flavobacteriaceae bacterium]|nr:hypothetical protein [Flavobacteriaceae bacterium]